MSRIPQQIIILMRERFRSGAMQKSIVQEFGVSKGYVSRLVRDLNRTDSDGNAYVVERSKLRRRRVIELVEEGLNNAEIGQVLGIHPDSVCRLKKQFRDELYQARGICPISSTAGKVRADSKRIDNRGDNAT